MTASLDLFSTSQTRTRVKGAKRPVTDRQIYDACLNNAPFFAYKIDGKKWMVVQGCCNSWNCPRCGQQRAREEYGRIVSGARELGKKHQLYFLTLTCRGKEISVNEAENGYLLWTNRLLTRLRSQAKRSGLVWAYAGVTERQERGHPHTHYITTYCPPDGMDVSEGMAKYFHTSGETFISKHDTIQSEYIERACVECGLGRQYDFSRLESVEAGSRYAAKYLFKADMFSQVWPVGWRRVRYSQNYPRLPEKESDAIVLLSALDWAGLARQALIIKTPDDGVAQVVRSHLARADVIIQ